MSFDTVVLNIQAAEVRFFRDLFKFHFQILNQTLPPEKLTPDERMQ